MTGERQSRAKHDRSTLTPSIAAGLMAMINAAECEWRAHAPIDWTTIDFRRWPRGFHRSAWVVAGTLPWNPFDVLGYPPTPAARAVNALLTRQCIVFTIVMASQMPDPVDPAEPLLAWFNATAREHQDEIAETVETLGAVAWDLPASHRLAARRLIKMWEQGGAGAFGDLFSSANNMSDFSDHGQSPHARGHAPTGAVPTTLPVKPASCSTRRSWSMAWDASRSDALRRQPCAGTVNDAEAP